MPNTNSQQRQSQLELASRLSGPFPGVWIFDGIPDPDDSSHPVRLPNYIVAQQLRAQILTDTPRQFLPRKCAKAKSKYTWYPRRFYNGGHLRIPIAGPLLEFPIRVRKVNRYGAGYIRVVWNKKRPEEFTLIYHDPRKQGQRQDHSLARFDPTRNS